MRLSVTIFISELAVAVAVITTLQSIILPILLPLLLSQVQIFTSEFNSQTHLNRLKYMQQPNESL
jgi:hypothetical protein